jgi:hypothetical protein
LPWQKVNLRHFQKDMSLPFIGLIFVLVSSYCILASIFPFLKHIIKKLKNTLCGILPVKIISMGVSFTKTNIRHFPQENEKINDVFLMGTS